MNAGATFKREMDIAFVDDNDRFTFINLYHIIVFKDI